MKILTAAQMGDVDRLTAEQFNIPSIILMENAGRSVADEIEKARPGFALKRIVILCGKGNNGGDGLVVARQLAMRGARPEILLFADPSQLKGDALANWEMVRLLGLRIHILNTGAGARGLLRRMPAPDIVVDALFGTGLSKPLGSDFRPAIDWINGAGAKALIVSVDVPSGILADLPAIPGPAVRSHLTVTFTALKMAQVMPPASDLAGKVVVAAIGSPPSLLANPEYRTSRIDAALVRQVIPPRPRESHKGSFGHLFVVAGSRGKSGAALMTGVAALRSGAGLVTLWLPESLQREATGKIPELMTESLPETPEGSPHVSGCEKILARLRDADALVVGPGLTTSRGTCQLVHELVRHSGVPVVVDADGVNAFARHPAELKNERNQPIVITPHPGEMARLTGRTVAKIQRDRLETARSSAAQYGLFTVLKGYQTIVAAPTGHLLINSTGNPGMATGGSGDILAGMVGCMAGRWNRKYHGADLQHLARYIAAAVYLHGLAGDLAAEEKGEESLIATDLVPHLPGAFRRVLRDR